MEGGEARKFKRVDGSNSLWEVHAEPGSDADVTLTLPATADCEAYDAVCTASDKPLSQGVTITIPGPAPEPTLHRNTGTYARGNADAGTAERKKQVGAPPGAPPGRR